MTKPYPHYYTKELAARRVLDISEYIDEITECPRRSAARKAELIESAYAFKKVWMGIYNELKLCK